MSCQRTIMADSRNAANISFDNVRVDAGGSVIGDGVDEGWAVLEPVLDRGRVAHGRGDAGLRPGGFRAHRRNT